MRLKIVLDIETDPDHAWLLDNDLVAEAVHEAFEFYKNDYVTAKVSYIEKKHLSSTRVNLFNSMNDYVTAEVSYIEK
jgi:hypothetical protein